MTTSTETGNAGVLQAVQNQIDRFLWQLKLEKQANPGSMEAVILNLIKLSTSMMPGFRLHYLLGSSDDEVAGNLDRLISFLTKLRQGEEIDTAELKALFLD